MSKILKNTGKFVGFGMLAGVFVLIFGIYWQLGHGESADYDSVKEAINKYGEDLNEMREYLYLPANNYDFFKANVTDAQLGEMAAPEDKNYQKGVKLFADELAKNQLLLKNQEEARAVLTELIKDQLFVAPLNKAGLTIGKDIEIDEDYAKVKILNGKDPLAQILLSFKGKQYSIQSILGVQTLSAEAIRDFLMENKERIMSKKSLIQTQKLAVTELLKDSDIAKTLTQNTLQFKPEAIENTSGFEYYVTDLNGSPLLTVTIDRETGKFLMESVGYENAQALKEPLLSKLKTLNGETSEVKAIKDKKSQLEAYLQTEEFKGTLNKAGIEILTAKEEAGKTIHELIYSDTKKPLAQINFDNQTGDLSFIDAADGSESSLEDILSGSKKKP